MKKLILLVTVVVIAVGAYFGWKMWKGEGCCGWGGDNVDPWTTYTPPTEEPSASTETPAA